MDRDKLDRNNFRNCLEAMARPGTLQPLVPYDHSQMMAMASMLLYSEVSFFQAAQGDWEMIKLITGTIEKQVAEADYLFLDAPESTILEEVKLGEQQNPELSATLICSCADFETGTQVIMRGPGIQESHKMILPVTGDFLNTRAEKNKHFPIGVDLFFIGEDNRVCGIPRTTAVEVL